MNSAATGIIPALQFGRAYMIARHYQHAWATQLAPDQAYARHDWTQEAIQKYTHNAMAGYDDPYIAAPCFDEHGAIVHTTKGRRLTWRTTPVGSVHVTINRPQGVACTASISEDRQVTIDLSDQLQVCYRHLEALRDFLMIFFSHHEADHLLEKYWQEIHWTKRDEELIVTDGSQRAHFLLEETTDTGGMRYGNADASTCLRMGSVIYGKHYTRAYPVR
jgi:hypothetical protein